MSCSNSRRFGFTLTELMVVIVIIGILSAVAMPAYRGYTFKVKTAEIYVLFDSIKKAQIKIYSEDKYFLYSQSISEGGILSDLANGNKIIHTGGSLINSDSSQQVVVGYEHLPLNFFINVGSGGGADQNGNVYGDPAGRFVYEEGDSGSACNYNPVRSSAVPSDYGISTDVDSGYDWFVLGAMMNMAAPGNENCAFFVQSTHTVNGEIVSNPVIQILN